MYYSAKDIDVLFFIDLVREAGSEMMKIYELPIEVEKKADNSPVTTADKMVNQLLIERISKRYPGSEFITEEAENAPYDTRKNWTSFWLIDPLDGTKEFIKKNGEFTINIALVEMGVPVFGIVFAPALGRLFYGWKEHGSFEVTRHHELLQPAPFNEQSSLLKVALSRSHINEKTLNFLKQLRAAGKEIHETYSGSSLKICLIATGEADVYPRFGPTMEWDTAAAHAVVLYAGKNVVCYDSGRTLQYNKSSLRNPDFMAM